MTSRKAKRMLNESDDWILFTMKKRGETQAELGAILTAADAYRDQQAQDEPE